MENEILKSLEHDFPFSPERLSFTAQFLLKTLSFDHLRKPNTLIPIFAVFETPLKLARQQPHDIIIDIGGLWKSYIHFCLELMSYHTLGVCFL